jgi:hypothetical protein
MADGRCKMNWRQWVRPITNGHPDGPPDVADAWLRNLLPRWRFAVKLAHNEYKGTRWRWSDTLLDELDSPAALLDQLSYLLLGGPLDETAVRRC